MARDHCPVLDQKRPYCQLLQFSGSCLKASIFMRKTKIEGQVMQIPGFLLGRLPALGGQL